MSDKENPKNLDKAALNALLSATPDAIHAKLDVLKKALDDKTYTVGSERIAEAILEISQPEKVSEEVTEKTTETETI